MVPTDRRIIRYNFTFKGSLHVYITQKEGEDEESMQERAYEEAQGVLTDDDIYYLDSDSLECTEAWEVK